jgi:hypothetical protein
MVAKLPLGSALQKISLSAETVAAEMERRVREVLLGIAARVIPFVAPVMFIAYLQMAVRLLLGAVRNLGEDLHGFAGNKFVLVLCCKLALAH